MAPPSRIFISKSMKGHLTPMTWKNSMINSGIIRRPVIQVMGYPLVMCWNSMMKQGVPFFMWIAMTLRELILQSRNGGGIHTHHAVLAGSFVCLLD